MAQHNTIPGLYESNQAVTDVISSDLVVNRHQRFAVADEISNHRNDSRVSKAKTFPLNTTSKSNIPAERLSKT